MTLADGTSVRPGDPVVELHWVNERLPQIPEHGPDLGWAAAMRRGIATSLAMLADYLSDPRHCAGAAGIRGSMAFGSRLGSPQVARWVRRFGFEAVGHQRSSGSVASYLRDAGDGLALLGLGWAFNPGSLRNKGFFRERHEIWTSRTALIARFASADRPRPAVHACTLVDAPVSDWER